MDAPQNSIDSPKQGLLIEMSAAGCSIAFILILGISAYGDRTIRLLHLFEAFPYAAAAGLILRRKKLGYMLGAVGGAFWLWTAGLLTTFIRNGFERVAMLLRTGHVDRLDILIAAPAACATAGLVLFSIWGYLRVRNKSWRDVGLFAATIVAVAGFFVANFAVFAPRYLGQFRPLFGK
jgi:hypothetical protein